MVNIDPTIVSLLTQGGFAALFVWLLLDTRKESNRREEKLTGIIEKYAEAITVWLPKVDARLSDIELEIGARK